MFVATKGIFVNVCDLIDVQFLKMLEVWQNHNFARYIEIPDDVTTVSSRPPSVRVDHGYSILIVCLAGASAAMTVKANA